MSPKLLLVFCTPDCDIDRPDHSHHKRDADVVKWLCRDGELWIDFNNDSPFLPPPGGERPKHFHAARGFPTPPAAVDPHLDIGQTLCPNSNTVHCKDYKYTVTVQRPGSPPCPPLDPRMIIDDGSGVVNTLTSVLALTIGLALTAWALTQLTKRDS